MDLLHNHQLAVTRRELFGRSAVGLGTAALASLLGDEVRGERSPVRTSDVPHFAPKAKHVIYLLHNGAPPHVAPYSALV